MPAPPPRNAPRARRRVHGLAVVATVAALASCTLTASVSRSAAINDAGRAVPPTTAPEAADPGAAAQIIDKLYDFQRATVEHHRSVVLRAADRARDGNGKLGGAADGVIAVDLGLGGGAHLERTKLRLARDHALLNALAAAHAELAKMPWTERAPPELVAKLDADFLYSGDARGNTCSGDSGGPAFATDASRSWPA